VVRFLQPSKANFVITPILAKFNTPKMGVKIKISTAFEENDAILDKWSHVVVATGTSPNIPEFTYESGVRVLTYEDVLKFKFPVQSPVVVIGAGGVACDVAKYILKTPNPLQASSNYLQNNMTDCIASQYTEGAIPSPKVTILQRSSKKLAYKLGRTTRWILIQELTQLGGMFMRGASIESISKCAVKAILIDRKQMSIPAKTIVLATGQNPNLLVTSFLEIKNIPFTVIGSASKSINERGSISSSIKSGYNFALSIN